MVPYLTKSSLQQLQFLINDGIITVPDSTGGSTSVESGSIELPDYPVEGPGPSNNVVDVTEEWSITGGFAESSYDSGDPITLSFVTDAPRSAGIKIGIFDSNDELIYTDVISAVKDEFGGGVQSEATVPRYYNMDEKLTMSYFLVGANNNKFSSSTTIIGPRVNLEVDSRLLSDVTNTATVKLADAVTEDIRIRIFDSDRVVLHDDTVTTNDFGVGKMEYTVPTYYLEDEPIKFAVSFANDPNMVEREWDATIGLTKTDLTITSDKTAYAAGDAITITITTNPPVSTDIKILMKSTGKATQWKCFENYLGESIMNYRFASGVGDKIIQTNANGISTITGEIAEDDCATTLRNANYYNHHDWNDGFYVYTDDDRFEENELIITAK